MFMKTAEPPPMPSPAHPAPAAVHPHCDQPSHLPAPPLPASAPTEGLPEAVTKVNPDYPLVAQQANVDGTVLAWLLVCEHGNVVDIRIVKSIAMLDNAAATALAQWKFRPAMRDNAPVPAWIQVPMKFTLQ
jgi:TonB family protein